jgi:HSP20 family protein
VSDEGKMKRVSEEASRRVKEFEYSSGCLEPLHEVSETSEDVIISFDLPGVNKEDISIRATENKVYVDAECRREIYVRRWGVRSHEKVFKRYRKAISLPSTVDPDKTKARLKGGVLEIRFPKRKGGTKIEVE